MTRSDYHLFQVISDLDQLSGIPWVFSAFIRKEYSRESNALISEMYTNLTANIKTDIAGLTFNINKGVRQGDPLSPLLFNCALDEVFKYLN